MTVIPLADAIGWAGAACLLLAHARLSSGRLAIGVRYHLLNLVGAGAGGRTTATTPALSVALGAGREHAANRLIERPATPGLVWGADVYRKLILLGTTCRHSLMPMTECV